MYRPSRAGFPIILIILWKFIIGPGGFPNIQIILWNAIIRANAKRKGRRPVACAPHTSFEFLHLCFSEHCLYACRGQRHLIGYQNKHPIGANKHRHRHNRCGSYVLMFHLLKLSSSFRALPRNNVRNSEITFFMPTITWSIAICQGCIRIAFRAYELYWNSQLTEAGKNGKSDCSYSCGNEK